MNFQRINKNFKVFADLKFALFLLFLIALISSIGTVIEQNEVIQFYQTNYTLENPVYGFINWKLILFLGLDNVYATWWFTNKFVFKFTIFG